MRPYEHPMIDATLRNAGPLTRVVACNIMRGGYTIQDRNGVPEVELAAQLIANAVVDDQRGSCPLNDRYILQDPRALPVARRAAGERQDLRLMVGTILMNLANTDVPGWRRFIDQLAFRSADVSIHP